MNERDVRYEELYDQLLTKAESLHEVNKKRIRRGLIGLGVLPVILCLILWLTESDKIVFLIIWVVCMFALCAYLIGVEYMDDSIIKALNQITDREAEFDDLVPVPGELQEMIRERVMERRKERALLRMRNMPAKPADEDNSDIACPDEKEGGQ